jgi:cytosine/adenosine deaminase-related metal-dependent hydrolase
MPDSTLTRRQLLAGAGAATLWARGLPAQPLPGGALVFSRTTIVNPDSVQHDAALAVEGDKIAAIGPSADVLARYPRATVYDGQGKALLPGLVNCHAHLAATIERGFNEDFGFPNSYRLAKRPESLLSTEENRLMAVMGALESIRCGTTTVVEYTGEIASTASALADTGLRWVFAESVSDVENSAGPVSAESLARSDAPRFSPRLRDEGWQRAQDLFEAWHGKEEGRIRVFPTTALAENSSPELLHAVREFAEKHDLGYTVHLAQTSWEVEYMLRHHGLRPSEYLAKHEFLGPRLFAAHCRYVDDTEVALLGRSGTIVTQQAHMAANRGVIPPIPALRAAGCPIAQGTDNNTNDMLETMRIALVTERIRRDDATPGRQPQPEDMLADAAQGGARAVRQEALIGSLEVGKKADLIVLDARRTHLVPAGRILSAWINNGQPSDVESVMVDGRFVMRDRKILTVDEESLVAEADKVGRRIWSEVEAASPVIVPRLPRS